MTADRFSVPAADGRRLGVRACGPADGLPFVFHSGTPSGLVAYDPMTEAAAALGLRTVIYSRPGYGRSAPHPGRLVADAAADVTAILNHAGAGPFVTAGWSGGGPHALACAALLPGRCLAAASIAGVAPYDGEGSTGSAIWRQRTSRSSLPRPMAMRRSPACSRRGRMSCATSPPRRWQPAWAACCPRPTTR